MSGRVVHFEVPFDDAERAQRFYREAFGWNIQHMPEFDYSFVTTGPTSPEDGAPTEPGYIGGGMMQRGEPWKTPVITVDVDDIDAALAKVNELGGKTVMEKQPVGEMGFTAYFTDSEGNLMGMWQSASPAG
ncbi:VOC family protein [Georgenia sp. AZ-5]|uniref:VOC family protein n=1 Tax=Georgenia sp. AZ-5 TaxID=3367526 RepID=UPI0037542834